jgi:hypothetical protein
MPCICEVPNKSLGETPWDCGYLEVTVVSERKVLSWILKK